MNRLVSRLLSAGFLLGLLGAAAAASSKEGSREIEAKVALESSLERRLQAVLREALGSDDLIVIVNVSLRSDAAAQDDAEVMPGVPVKAQSPDSEAMSLPMVSRLTATIMVDEALEAKDVDLVSKVANGILGISKSRGDSLAVEKIKFHKPRAQQDAPRYAASATSALWLILTVVGAVMLQKKFLGPLISNLRDISAAALLRERGAQRTEALEPEPAAAAAESSAARSVAAASNGARAYHPFSFVGAADLPKLVYILRRTNASETATIIQYLPSDLASKALADLEPVARRSVIGALAKVTQLDADLVKPLEETLRKRLDFLIGGEDKLVELLDSLPLPIQSDLLEALRADNPGTAEAVSRRLVFIEDLALLEPAEIKLLSRRVPAKVLAVLLKATPSLRDELLPKLAGGTREWLTQEIDFSQDPSPEVLESARRLVLAAVSQLVREGRISLRKKAVVENAAAETVAVEGA